MNLVFVEPTQEELLIWAKHLFGEMHKDNELLDMLEDYMNRQLDEES